MQTFGKILLRYRDKIGEGESGEENVRILPYRYRKVFSLDACFEGREWTLEVRFLGRVGRLCYRLYGGHRSFPRAVLARSARMERARSKITRMPHPRYTRTPDYILYLDPVLEPVLFLFIFYRSMNRPCSSLPSFHVFCACVKLMYVYVHGYFFLFWLNFFDWIGFLVRSNS